MRKSKSLVFGVVCGLCCMLSVGLYIAMLDDQAAREHSEMLSRYGGEQIEVVVARRDIAQGEIIEDAAIETRMWVSALLPEGALTTPSEAVGKQVGSSILKGEVISTRRFGLAQTAIDVPEGLSAVSVPARDVQAVGGILRAGMRVDVYAVGSSSTAKILSGVSVVDTSVKEDAVSISGDSVQWVTLAVAPGRVQELVTAAQNLELYFVLPGEAAPAAGESSEGEGEA